VSNSERRKTNVETPPIVSKSRRTQRRLVGATLHGRPLRVKAAKVPRRQFLHLAAGAAALPALSRVASAQVYPSRPITMIVPIGAGSATDTAARVIVERMRVPLGRPILIENVSGADGNIGVGRAARATPDGYTILFSFSSAMVLNAAFYALPYDVLTDFAPILPLTRAWCYRLRESAHRWRSLRW
jgi:tripartite-type tricarboxylate transporter receptor subunit TctC